MRGPVRYGRVPADRLPVGPTAWTTMMRHRVFPEREHDPVPDIRPVPATFVVDPAR